MDSHKTEQVFGSSKNMGLEARSADDKGTYDDRLGHILKAATQIIARDGYERASMRSVAAAASISLAGLYHYFDSKEKMLFLIQFRTFSALLNNLREKLHGVSDPIEQLHVMVKAHVCYFAANMAALKVCSHELDSLNGEGYEETRKIRREYYDLACGIIRKILDARENGTVLDERIVSMTLFGALNWLYRWYHPRKDRSPVAIANQMTAQFLNGILGDNNKADEGK